jgi:hypothetical protein
VLGTVIASKPMLNATSIEPNARIAICPRRLESQLG